MGLGPPVCLKCLCIMQLDEKWHCATPNCPVDQNHPEHDSLFCLTDEQLAEMDRRWGTKELATRIKNQEIMAVYSAREAIVRKLAYFLQDTSPDKNFSICWREAEAQVPLPKFN